MSRPESMEGHKLGTELRDEDRRYVLRHYTHRYTGNHRPLWSRERRPNGEPYPLQFANDRDWLANTFFRVRKNGRLDMRSSHCFSYPTFPQEPLRERIQECIRRHIEQEINIGEAVRDASYEIVNTLIPPTIV